jgi:hypothetical protein
VQTTLQPPHEMFWLKSAQNVVQLTVGETQGKQAPAWQTVAGLQMFPQVPQFCSSLFLDVQKPPQHESPMHSLSLRQGSP